MDDEAFARVAALEAENRELRERLERMEERAAKSSNARRGFFSGLRLLVPILDRYKVVKTFGNLIETLARFSTERARWPEREEIVGDARLFMEAVVRFLVRRRLFMLIFTILALAIPAMQVYLAFQQNRIVENQNQMFEIQVYDVVASALTEGDRNARVMTGALLARTEPGFLEGVVRETFDPSLSEVYRPEGVDAVQRRLEDAAHRGYLVRALDRAVAVRSKDTEPLELHRQIAGPSQLIIADAAARIPAILRLGRPGSAIDGALAEQVDNYLVHVGSLMATDARLARAAGEEQAFWVRSRPLFERLAPLAVGAGQCVRRGLPDAPRRLLHRPRPGARAGRGGGFAHRRRQPGAGAPARADQGARGAGRPRLVRRDPGGEPVSRGIAFALGALLACGGGPTPVTPEQTAPPASVGGGEVIVVTPDEGSASTAVAIAVGRGETEDEALETARAAFREAVLGPWGRESTLVLYDPAADPVEWQQSDDLHEARIPLERARAEALLAALPQRLPRPAFAAELEPLHALQEGAIAAFVCERRAALLGEACVPPDLDAALALAGEAVRDLTLVAVYEDGVPMGPGGQLLVKPTVQLNRGGRPATGFAGLPLIARPAGEAEEVEPVRVAVDGHGRAYLDVDPRVPRVVSLDRGALVPPMASVFGELRAPMVARQASAQRWSLVLTSTADPATDDFGRAFATALRSSGAGARQPLASTSRRAILDARTRSSALRALSVATHGAVDVVLVAEVSSHFASRMGSRRVWYEATARMTAYSVWTGEVLTELSARANANGIGDARAEAASREDVARDLARQLASVEGMGLRPRPPQAKMGAALQARR